MTYYWDSSHFTEKVGVWILNRIFDKNQGVPNDFGILISPINIESHLKSIRDKRELYFSENRLEMLAIIADFKSIANGAPLDNSRMKDMF